VKLSRVIVFDGRGTNLDLVILSIVCTKDLGGKNLLSIICDSPNIGGAATLGSIIGLE
jgi:hypothetical protein